MLTWQGEDGGDHVANDDGDGHWTGIGVNGFKTSTKRNTLNPIWNDSFLIPIMGRPTGKEVLKVQLWDWDMGKQDDFVGILKIPMTESLRVDTHRRSFDGLTAWYKVTDNDGKKVSAWNSGKRPGTAQFGVEDASSIWSRAHFMMSCLASALLSWWPQRCPSRTALPLPAGRNKDGIEPEPEVQLRLRIVKKGTLEQFIAPDKTKSLQEASLKVIPPSPMFAVVCLSVPADRPRWEASCRRLVFSP